MNNIPPTVERSAVTRRDALVGAAAVGIVSMTLPSPVAAESVGVEGQGQPTTTVAPPAEGAPSVTVTDAGTFTVTW